MLIVDVWVWGLDVARYSWNLNEFGIVVDGVGGAMGHGLPWIRYVTLFCARR